MVDFRLGDCGSELCCHFPRRNLPGRRVGIVEAADVLHMGTVIVEVEAVAYLFLVMKHRVCPDERRSQRRERPSTTVARPQPPALERQEILGRICIEACGIFHSVPYLFGTNAVLTSKNAAAHHLHHAHRASLIFAQHGYRRWLRLSRSSTWTLPQEIPNRPV